MLKVDDVSVTFGGVKAVSNVSIEVEAGQVTGLIGPNGAGKTTLFNVITGLQRPNQGRVHLEGADVTGRGPKARARKGMGRTFQRLEIFGSLSTRDNILVAVENTGVHGRAARKKAEELMQRCWLLPLADTQSDVLPTGLARLLELARALACSPKVLLLDEPFSGLDSSESVRLGQLIVELVREGLAVLLVEHDMEMVMKLCAHIYVLSFGSIIASGDPAQIKSDPAVQEAYLGTPAEAAGAGS